MKTLSLALACALLSPNCSDANLPRPNVVQKDDKDDCAKACGKARELQCDEGKDLIYPNECIKDKDCQDGICKEGYCTETCEMLCEAFVEEGRKLGLKCWSKIETCSQIENICRAD